MLQLEIVSCYFLPKAQEDLSQCRFGVPCHSQGRSNECGCSVKDHFERILFGLALATTAGEFEIYKGQGTDVYPHLRKSRSLQGVPGSPGKSQKQGQEDQGTSKQLHVEGIPLALALLGPPGIPSCSSLGSLELPSGVYLKGDKGTANQIPPNSRK